MMPKRILFPTDFSPCANTALAHALFQAEAYGADLHILHSVHWEEQHTSKGMPEPDTIMKEMQKVAQVRLQEMLETHPEKTFKIVEKCMIGPTPVDVITDYIAENNIGLVVMGTHGRRGISHFLLGSVAEELARTVSCPVITVRDKGEHTDLTAIRRVLAPVDFSVQSRHSLHRARQFAKLHGAELYLLNVIHEFDQGFGSVDSGFELLNEVMPKLVEKQKRDLIAFYKDITGEDVPHHTNVMIGKAAWRISDFAKRNDIDYIVMGTHGYGGFNHLILGSVTERVIRTSPCPVYTMKVLS